MVAASLLLCVGCGPRQTQEDATVVRVEIEVRAFCYDGGCNLSAFDQATQFSATSWQLSRGGTDFVYGCGEFKKPPTLARALVTWVQTDGGTRVAPEETGAVFMDLQLSPQLKTGELYTVHPDGTLGQVETAAAASAQTASSITFRYPVTEVIDLNSGLPRSTPNLGAEELHHFSSSTERVKFTYDAVCTPGQPTGWY
jgi:hypothetical protein